MKYKFYKYKTCYNNNVYVLIFYIFINIFKLKQNIILCYKKEMVVLYINS